MDFAERHSPWIVLHPLQSLPLLLLVSAGIFAPTNAETSNSFAFNLTADCDPELAVAKVCTFLPNCLRGTEKEVGV